MPNDNERNMTFEITLAGNILKSAFDARDFVASIIGLAEKGDIKFTSTGADKFLEKLRAARTEFEEMGLDIESIKKELETIQGGGKGFFDKSEIRSTLGGFKEQIIDARQEIEDEINKYKQVANKAASPAVGPKTPKKTRASSEESAPPILAVEPTPTPPPNPPAIPAAPAQALPQIPSTTITVQGLDGIDFKTLESTLAALPTSINLIGESFAGLKTKASFEIESIASQITKLKTLAASLKELGPLSLDITMPGPEDLSNLTVASKQISEAVAAMKAAPKSGAGAGVVPPGGGLGNLLDEASSEEDPEKIKKTIASRKAKMEALLNEIVGGGGDLLREKKESAYVKFGESTAALGVQNVMKSENEVLTTLRAEFELRSDILKLQSELNSYATQEADAQKRANLALERSVELLRLKNESYKQNPDLLAHQESERLQTEAARLRAQSEAMSSSPDVLTDQAASKASIDLMRESAGIELRSGNESLALAEAKNKILSRAISDEAAYKTLMANESLLEKDIVTTLLRGKLTKEQKLKVLEKYEAELIKIKGTELDIALVEKRAQKAAIQESPQRLSAAYPNGGIFDVGRRMFMWTSATAALWQTYNALRNSVTATIDLEYEMAQLQKIMGNTKSMEGVRESLFGISEEFGVPVKSVAESMRVWVQQGFEVAEALKLTETSLLAVNSADMEGAQAVNMLTSAYHTFGIEIKDLPQVVDAIMRVQADFAVTAQDLAAAIERIGPAVADMGGDIDLLNGMVAAVGTVTRKTGNIIGTSIKTMISRLTKDDVIRSLESIGVKVRRSSTEFRDLGVILDDLHGKWQDLGKGQRIDLAKQIGGTRMFADFLALMDRYDIVMAASEASQSAWGDAAKANAIQMGTLRKHLDLLGVSLTKLATDTASSSFFKMLGQGVFVLTKFVDIINWLPGKGIILFVGGVTAASLALKKLNIDIIGNIMALRDWMATQAAAARSKSVEIAASATGASVAAQTAATMGITGSIGQLAKAGAGFSRAAIGGALGPIGITLAVSAAIDLVSQLITKLIEARKEYKELHEISQESLESLKSLHIESTSAIGPVWEGDMQKALVGINSELLRTKYSFSEFLNLLRRTPIGKGKMIDLFPDIQINPRTFETFSKQMETALDFQMREVEAPMRRIAKDLAENFRRLMSEEFLNEGKNPPDARFLSEFLSGWMGPQNFAKAYEKQVENGIMPLRAFFKSMVSDAGIDYNLREVFKKQLEKGITPENIGSITEAIRNAINKEKPVELKISPEFNTEAGRKALLELQKLADQIPALSGLIHIADIPEQEIDSIDLLKTKVKNFYIDDAQKAIEHLKALNDIQGQTFGRGLNDILGDKYTEGRLDDYLKSLGSLRDMYDDLKVQLSGVASEIATLDANFAAQSKAEGLLPSYAESGKNAFEYYKDVLDLQNRLKKGDISPRTMNKEDYDKARKDLIEKQVELEKSLSTLETYGVESAIKDSMERVHKLIGQFIKEELPTLQAQTDIAVSRAASESGLREREHLSESYVKLFKELGDARLKYLQNNIESNSSLGNERSLSKIRVDNIREVARLEMMLNVANFEARKAADEKYFQDQYKAIQNNAQLDAKTKAGQIAQLEEQWGKEGEQVRLSQIDFETKQRTLALDAEIEVVSSRLNERYDRINQATDKIKQNAEDLRAIIAESIGDLGKVTDAVTKGGNQIGKDFLKNLSYKGFQDVMGRSLKTLLPDKVGIFLSDERTKYYAGLAQTNYDSIYKAITDAYDALASKGLLPGVEPSGASMGEGSFQIAEIRKLALTNMPGTTLPLLGLTSTLGTLVKRKPEVKSFPKLGSAEDILGSKSPYEYYRDMLEGKQSVKWGKAIDVATFAGDIIGSLSGAEIARQKGLETNYAGVGAGLGGMLPMLLGIGGPAGLALGLLGSIAGGLIGGGIGEKAKKQEEYLREIADNTSTLKDLPQGIFNAPANFTLPPKAWAGTGVSNFLQGNVHINIYPQNGMSPGDIAKAVRVEIDNAFNPNKRVGAKAVPF